MANNQGENLPILRSYRRRTVIFLKGQLLGFGEKYLTNLLNELI